MADATALEARIGEIFRDRLNLSVPSPHTDLFEAGVLDSLSFVELLLQLENEFALKISLDDLELDNFRSIARIAAFIAGATAGARDADPEPPGSADFGRSIGSR